MFILSCKTYRYYFIICFSCTKNTCVSSSDNNWIGGGGGGDKYNNIDDENFKDTLSDNSLTGSTLTEDLNNEAMGIENTTAENTTAENTTSENTTVENTTAENTVSENTTSENTIVENTTENCLESEEIVPLIDMSADISDSFMNSFYMEEDYLNIINNSIEHAFNNLTDDNINSLSNGSEITLNIDIPIFYEEIHDEEDIIDIAFFDNCKEINQKLGKAKKINDDDILIIENKSCPICMAEYCTGEFKRILPECKHVFHKKCIDTWLKIHGNCPICRYEYK